MARVAQEIPKIGLVMEAVKVVRWLKNVGDAVMQGEPLVEVETEKSIVEIEAAASGRLNEILLQVDQEATVGDPIAWIETGEPASAPTPMLAASPARPHANAPAAAAAPYSSAASSNRIRSTPVARKLAAEHGVDLGAVTGSGPGGRVQLADVERSLESPAASTTGQALSPMRRALARAMTLSNATIPQFFVERSVDWTVLQAKRNELLASPPAGIPKLSVNDFLLQAIARSLVEFPDLNATFSGSADSPAARILPAEGAHIGLVVAVDNGLLVPVLHRVDQLGLAAIARRRADCVERALAGRLKRDDLDGATVSLSNLGARGPDRFTAIINPPQSAILAVGRQRPTLALREGVAVTSPQSVLTLTVDHRVADGRLASEFLARLIVILEGPDWRLF
ncbi:MAG: dihydrolipoamide acetyltransferase family protein [Steroidobacterales bacterium]